MAKTAMCVTMLGRVTGDPSIKEYNRKDGTGTGCYAHFSVAVERPFSEKKDENGQTISDFWNVDTSGVTAEFVQKYVKKANLVFMRGYFKRESYVNQNGQEVEAVVFKAQEVLNASPNPNNGGQNNGGQNNGNWNNGQNGGQNYGNQGNNGQNYGNQGNWNNGQNGGQNYNNQGNNSQNYGNQGNQNNGSQNNGNWNNGQNGSQNYGNQGNNGQNNQGGQQQSEYLQNGGGYQQNGGGYSPQNGNSSQNNSAPPMNPPEGFGMSDDDPFGLFSGDGGNGAPAGY